jgi:hypothetical protein
VHKNVVKLHEEVRIKKIEGNKVKKKTRRDADAKERKKLASSCPLSSYVTKNDNANMDIKRRKFRYL